MIKYTTINNFLTSEECNLIVRFSLDKGLKPALTGKNSEKTTKIRDSNVFFYNYTNEFPNLNTKLIEIFKKEVNVKGFDIDFTNNLFQFTEYKTSGHYGWHTDSSNVMYPERYCSMVIQLTDDYDGGELQIMDENDKEITLDRGLGNLFLFYSYITHRVKPVITGTRYSLVNWFKLTQKENYNKTLI